MEKYRKKPVVIETVRLLDSYASILECIEFMDGKIDFDINHNEERFLDYVGVVQKEKGIIIHTLEGDMKASFGDYIIKGINGEFYPCKPEIFDKTYEIIK